MHRINVKAMGYNICINKQKKQKQKKRKEKKQFGINSIHINIKKYK